MNINNYLDDDIKEDFTSFINTDDPFSKDNINGHITGSCWIINRERTLVLLTQHKKLCIWIPTGGHSEGETDPFSIALREGEEETGIKLIPDSKIPFHMDIHHIPRYKSTPGHKHYDYTYLFYPESNENFIISDESFDLKWIPLDKIEEYTKEKNVLYMRNKTLEM